MRKEHCGQVIACCFVEHWEIIKDEIRLIEKPLILCMFVSISEEREELDENICKHLNHI
jgi:hypothetical protein